MRWERPNCPRWMCQKLYETMPRSIGLREIGCVVEQPGRKQLPLVIVTTMLEITGENVVSKNDLAELFQFRWNVELDIRSIKTHMNLHHLRCKSPEMVRKEARVTMLVYNAIRTTSLGGSWMTGVKPREVIFVSCCQFVLAAWEAIGERSGEQHRHYCVSQLKQIGKHLVSKRPGRFEPRGLKKRGSNYSLMTQPRQDLKERLTIGDNSFEK